MKNQLKYLILFCSIIYGINIQAQGPTCATATAAVLGANTADGPSDGGGAENVCALSQAATDADWYTYTQATNTMLTISSCLGGEDTRLSVYSGNCAGLVCIESNDDACAHIDGDPVEYASSVTFIATAGTIYYIQWDNRWSSDAFNWTINQAALDCPILASNIGDACDAPGTDDEGVITADCSCVVEAGSTCSTALPAVLGVNTADGPSAGSGSEIYCGALGGPIANDADWYTYTATNNVQLTIASCLGGADTRLSVYTGSCASLVCFAAGDDDCIYSVEDHNIWATLVTFEAVSGTTYYIQWDDGWSSDGFDWTITETLYDCPILSQNIGDACDFNGANDGIVNGDCACVSVGLGEVCSTAAAAVIGTNSINGPIDEGIAVNACDFDAAATNATWYTFTAPLNGAYKVSSCLGGVDTRVSVFDGSCATLNCVASNDDFCEMGPGESAWASSTTFEAVSGTTYYIQWDNRWSSDAFDWTLEEAICDCYCPELGLDIGDPCDGGIVNDACNCVPLGVPSCPTLVSPEQNAPTVEFDPNNSNRIIFNWSVNGVQTIDQVHLYIGSAPDNLILNVSTDPSFTGANLSGFFPGLFYWTVTASNSFGESPGCNVNQFTAIEKLDGVPNCSTPISPSDDADVALSLDMITWTNTLSGEPADMIDIYLGLDPYNLNHIGNVATNIESFNISGLIEQGLTYYWSVIPSNYLGESEHCDVFSFTVAGTPDCPSLGLNGLNVGSPCDDGNPFTDLEEVYLFADECVCVGIPIPINATCNGGTLVTEGVYPGNQISTGVGAINSCFPNGGTNALWYYYNATSDGYVTVDATIDSDQPDTRLSVYTGSCMDLTCHAFNDDAQGGFSSKVTFPVVDGEIYFIEWDDNWSTTEFDFEVSFDGSAYCSGATPITDGVYNDNFITLGSDGASDLCFGSGFVNDAKWFSYTSYGFGEVTVDATIDPINPDTRLSIYTGACDHLTCVTSNDWFDIGNNVRSSKVTFPVVFGETYLIEWDDRWAGTFFDFEVSFDGVFSCATDLDGNGTTNGDDFAIFLGNFGINCNSSFCATDFNNDGMTDGVDFGIFLGNFDLDCPAPN